MKKIKLITITKATGEEVWYKDLVGSLFLVSDSSDPRFLNVLKPIVGEKYQLQIDTNFNGFGVVQSEDVTVIAELDVM